MILLIKENNIEAWATLTSLCKYHKEFKYYYLRGLKFPFTYKGYTFDKIKLRK